jgi:non-specific serine/threonine protein kinase
MGVVYKARDLRLDRLVALKFLPHDLTPSDEDRSRFVREAKVASLLNHPNICIIHDIQDLDGQVFIVMEFVDGVTLRRKLQSPPFSISEVNRYATQIAEALCAAHARGIVHRDIKSENIMINSAGHVKVMDYGLAMTKESLAIKKNSGTVGTLAYMAPEVIEGREAIPQSDMFSYGVVLFEILAGQLPFQGGHPAAMVYAIVKQDPQSLERLRPDVPIGLRAVVERSLRKDPDERYASMEELLKALRSAMPGGEARPAPRLDVAIPGKTHNLPVQLTKFIGRVKQVVHLKELLSTARLVTLTGPGGTGKTRLALQVAWELIESFEDGVFFISLAPLADPLLVPSTVAQALGVHESEATPLKDTLLVFLRGRNVLLVLDNFEHLLAAASFVLELLGSCPGVAILVTSRASLQITGECEYPVPPLEMPERTKLPSAPELARYEAVALFAQRAAAAKPGFQVTDENAAQIAEICARLDGLPLAIELAAARIKLLTPNALLSRLDHRLKLLTGGAVDLPARHQTLRGAIAWSFDLLTPAESELFLRLSVFAGGFSLDAAAWLCKEDPDQNIDVLDGVASLADKSLLRQSETLDDEPRFTMLETIREFGLEHLHASAEAVAVRKAHAEYYLRLAEEADPPIHQRHDGTWINRLNMEIDNLRAALEHFRAAGDYTGLLRLSGALSWFFSFTNRIIQSLHWLECALQLSSSSPASKARSNAQCKAGQMYLMMGDYDLARSPLEESLTFCRKMGYELEIACVLENLCLLAAFTADDALGRTYQAEAIAIYRRLGAKQLLALTLANVVEPADDVVARGMYAESLGIFREIGNKWGVSRALRNLGSLSYHSEDYAGSREILLEALAIQRELNDWWQMGRSLNILGDLARCEADDSGAFAYYTESRLLSQSGGLKGERLWSICGLGFVAMHRGDNANARELFLECLNIRKSQRNRRGLAASLIGLASLARLRGEGELGIRILGAVDAAVLADPRVLLPADTLESEREKEAARAQVGDDEFARLLGQGMGLNIDEAVSCIVQENQTGIRKTTANISPGSR